MRAADLPSFPHQLGWRWVQLMRVGVGGSSEVSGLIAPTQVFPPVLSQAFNVPESL